MESTVDYVLKQWESGNIPALVILLVVAIPSIAGSVLKLHGAMTSARQVSQSGWRTKLDDLIDAAREVVMPTSNLRLEECFRLCYGYFASAGIVRTLLRQRQPSLAMRDFRRVRRHVDLIRKGGAKGRFGWIRERRRYRLPLVGVKMTAGQYIFIALYTVFVTTGLFTLSFVVNRWQLLAANPALLGIGLAFAFAMIALGVTALLEAASRHWAARFLVENSARGPGPSTPGGDTAVRGPRGNQGPPSADTDNIDRNVIGIGSVSRRVD